MHDEAAAAEDTDRPQILSLYGLLERMTGNPMVNLNRACGQRPSGLPQRLGAA